MKTAATLSAIVALAQAHATFQQLWKNGQDLESSCARLPPSNSPVTDYSSKDMQCKYELNESCSNPTDLYR
jgi:lytic cellulose monooxygenase (C1-hydroxylating)